MGTRSLKVEELSRKLDKICKYCKKNVNSSLDCVICDTGFHPSCAKQAKVINNKNKVNCCGKPRDKSEVRENKAEKVCEMDEDKIIEIIKGTLELILDPFKRSLKEELRNLCSSCRIVSMRIVHKSSA